VKSEHVGAPAGSSEAQDGEANSSNNHNHDNNSSGHKSSKKDDEPSAQAQGVGYKLPDGDILIHTQAQVGYVAAAADCLELHRVVRSPLLQSKLLAGSSMQL
jgi:hypothetical protein